MRHVARPLHLGPLDVSNPLEKGLDHNVLRFVVAPVDDQCRHVDEVQAVDDGPGFEGPRNKEFGWAVPGENG